MTVISNEQVASKQVLEFLTVANEYCLLVESCDKYPQQTLMEYLQRILPLLFIKGSLLPEIAPDDPDYHEKFVTEEQWEANYNSLKSFFDTYEHYWAVHHPGDPEPKTEKRSLAEDLADIYQDVKDFIILYQKPLTASKENAVAACRLAFEEFWGKKAIQAGFIIHQALNPCCSDHHEE